LDGNPVAEYVREEKYGENYITVKYVSNDKGVFSANAVQVGETTVTVTPQEFATMKSYFSKGYILTIDEKTGQKVLVSTHISGEDESTNSRHVSSSQVI